MLIIFGFIQEGKIVVRSLNRKRQEKTDVIRVLNLNKT